jgi:nitrate reductase molybdenum cofactor assembly chaperone NarJ/NarW
VTAAARGAPPSAAPPAAVSPTGPALACKVASVLLQYPTAALFEGLGALDEAVRAAPRPARGGLAAVLAWLRATPPDEVATHYVETFDLRRRCALYLTYYRHGDTRNRGMAMLAFKTAYRAAGWQLTGSELPDYLPLVLDFAAIDQRGQALLRRHVADLELLRLALHEAGTPYAAAVDAVCACLPRPGRRDLLLIRRAREQGPPGEEVGLEPFAPPGYLTGRGEPTGPQGAAAPGPHGPAGLLRPDGHPPPGGAL